MEEILKQLYELSDEEVQVIIDECEVILEARSQDIIKH